MRRFSLCLMLAAVSLGCNRAEEARREAAERNLRQMEVALRDYRARQASEPPIAAPPPDTAEQTDVAAQSVKQPATLVKDVAHAVDAGNQFALDLYQQLRFSEGNLFFSPSSISMALAMTYAGAAGETEAEMAKTLHFQKIPGPRLHQAMESLQAFWQAADGGQGVQLNVANRLWGQDQQEFLAPFLQVTREHYGAELARLDFANPEKASRTINSWIEDQTEDKITDLIPASALDANTRLVLTNAVYFHGSWTEPFKKDRTKDEDFYLTAADKVQVPMMHRQDGFRYAEMDDLQLLELPYGDGDLSMVVLLPKKTDGLSDLESELTLERLSQWLGSLQHESQVQVYLPKFKTTSQFEMSGTLAAMGMKSAFDAQTANFSSMTGETDLFISAVIHKAYVDVNEEGTEAAAATGAVMGVTSAIIEDPKEPPVFRADHPFVYLIRDNRNDVILFLGRMANPLD